ncbi:TRAP transporter large permease [Lysinibacillus antri]|uniref:TRAP transporter large permease n=1 Tax=Lysinibacillus antri TaxID=2498145 RepID=A0A432L7G9_9BACI|nr:TRAP transporter large permease [Lysinibacillus antri]RUL47777.1 TRAP transporter large permease [Lysinibacillus antri]
MGSTLLILTLVFVVCLIINVPIAISLAIAALTVVLIEGTIPISFLIQATFTSNDSFALLAVPFFILAGELMSTGGISKRLIDFFKSMVGSWTGSLGLITILASLIFAAISGSGAATVASIGGIMIPHMLKSGYKAPYAAALSASAGALGPIIPPSLVFIFYGIMAGVSISDMFIAGIVPGLLIAVTLIIINYIVCKKEGIVDVQTDEEKKSFWKALNEAKFALLTPVIILGGIYGGIVTPTEAAVLAVVYSLIVSLFIYKELKFSDLMDVFLRTTITSGTVMIFVGTATFFGRVLTLEQIPQYVANTISEFTTSPIVVLLLINVFLLVVGMFIETVAAILIFIPILLPIVVPLGIDPLHFGMVVCFNLTIGLLTPPLGLNLFIGAKVANVKFESTFKYLTPMLIALLILLGIITYVPEITLFLPELLAK